MRWAKHGRLRGAYLSFSGFTCRAAEVFEDVTTGVAGEYNTACRDALASRVIDSSSPTSQNDLSGGGQRERLIGTETEIRTVYVICLSSKSAPPPLVTLVTMLKIIALRRQIPQERRSLSRPRNDPSGATGCGCGAQFNRDGRMHSRLRGAYLSLRRRLPCR